MKGAQIDWSKGEENREVARRGPQSLDQQKPVARYKSPKEGKESRKETCWGNRGEYKKKGTLDLVWWQFVSVSQEKGRQGGQRVSKRRKEIFSHLGERGEESTRRGRWEGTRGTGGVSL